MNDTELGWVAGFLEGEGCFQGRCKGAVLVSCSQVQREPLERLEKLFGGPIRLYQQKNPKHQPYHRWHLLGDKAADLMMQIFHLMSPRRREQIEWVLRRWSASTGIGSKERAKTHCPKGHEYTPENTYYQPSTPNKRKCRICAQEYNANYYREHKQQRGEGSQLSLTE